MPMGLSSSPKAFNMVVTAILGSLRYTCAIPYLDDLLILSPDKQSHFLHLEKVFAALEKGKLKLGKSKCQYFLNKIEFLGMIVTPTGIMPNPKKVEVLKQFPRPKNIKQQRMFNGLCNFFRRFVAGFSKIMKPLYDLTKTTQKFKWTDKCTASFEEIKERICSDAMLHYPNFNKPFILSTDGSSTALGAILSQKDKMHSKTCLIRWKRPP